MLTLQMSNKLNKILLRHFICDIF